ncbi:MAG: penicillin-binding transpeptidase domain-containing protein [Thermodesulfobacteriota bacterium]
MMRKSVKKVKKGKIDTWLRFRIFLLFCTVIFFFGAIFLRAFQIQVVDGGALERRAESQHNGTVTVPSRRGDIFDRNMRELAVSLTVDSIYAQPRHVGSTGPHASVLAGPLSMSPREVLRRLNSKKQFVWLKRQVDLAPGEREAIGGLDGIGMARETRRYYPNRRLAANLLGFAGIDSDGLEGVELYHDKFLKAASRKVTVEKDARGDTLLFEDIERPAQGTAVVLTIDKTIQYITEKALGKAVKASGARGGTAVVMDPITGEILAMATLPTFDPNNFRGFKPSQWRNRAVTDAFEPGSTLKAFLLAAVIEEGVVGPRDIFYCENGSYRVADRTFHDTKKHGWLSLRNVITRSSNIGAVKVGEKLGKARLYRHLKNFGFGARTGVDLPGEARGSFRHYRNWSGVTLPTVSFGQGISVSALQLTTAMAAVANGGLLMKPYIVRSVRTAEGASLVESNPVVVKRVISGATAETVTDVLVGVTEAGGTGEIAAIDGFEVAGKTGTAQKPDLTRGGYMKDKYMASFLGFVPARDPKLVILVTVDEPAGEIWEMYGGVVAGPAFKEIAAETLSYLGVFPEGSGSPKRFEAVAPEKPLYREVSAEAVRAGRVPEFGGGTIRTVLREARAGSLNIDVIGSGRAVRQSPLAGEAVPIDAPIRVWFEPPEAEQRYKRPFREATLIRQ